jgi:hypothetical protein
MLGIIENGKYKKYEEKAKEYINKNKNDIIKKIHEKFRFHKENSLEKLLEIVKKKDQAEFDEYNKQLNDLNHPLITALMDFIQGVLKKNPERWPFIKPINDFNKEKPEVLTAYKKTSVYCTEKNGWVNISIFYDWLEDLENEYKQFKFVGSFLKNDTIVHKEITFKDSKNHYYQLDINRNKIFTDSKTENRSLIQIVKNKSLMDDFHEYLNKEENNKYLYTQFVFLGLLDYHFSNLFIEINENISIEYYDPRGARQIPSKIESVVNEIKTTIINSGRSDIVNKNIEEKISKVKLQSGVTECGPLLYILYH